MSQKRMIYRIDELNTFRKMAWNYLNENVGTMQRKSMGEFCEYMGITRKTLSKYKQRNRMWRDAINKIKGNIIRYNISIQVLLQADIRMQRFERMIEKHKAQEREKEYKEYQQEISEQVKGS